MEDMQKICDLLVPVLREMKGFHNVMSMEYWGDRGLVYIIFATNVQRVVYAGKNAEQMINNIICSQ